jgi:hypothetical protein
MKLFGCRGNELTKRSKLLARKKQGGSQSLNDNAKGKANSAGAMLRRYGEQSLKEVHRDLRVTISILSD